MQTSNSSCFKVICKFVHSLLYGHIKSYIHGVYGIANLLSTMQWLNYISIADLLLLSSPMRKKMLLNLNATYTFHASLSNRFRRRR